MRPVARCARLVTPALAAGALLALAGGPLPTSGPAAAQPAPAPVKVSMKDFAFMPATITIKAGATVTWTYDEVATDPMGCEGPQFQIPGAPVSCPGHSTTAVDPGSQNGHLWDSGVHRASGFPYSRTFTTPGTYKYYCTVHGGSMPNNPITHMDGTIVVEAAATSAAPAPAAPSPAAQVQAQTAPERSAAAGELAHSGGRLMLGSALALLLLGLALRSVRRVS